MIGEAIKYMVLGMGIVFIFLYLMVIILDWQYKIIHKYFVKDETPQKPSRREKLKKVAAIAAAIHHHKS